MYWPIRSWKVSVYCVFALLNEDAIPHLDSLSPSHSEKVPALLRISKRDLEPLTKPMQLLQTNERAGNLQEGQVDVGVPLVSDFEPLVAVEPALRLLHSPAMPTETLTAFHSAPGNAGDDVSLLQRHSAAGKVVALVSVHLLRPEPRLASPARAHLGHSIDDCFEHFAVMDVCSRKHHAERRSSAVYDDMALASKLTAVGGARSDSFLSAPFLLASGAATDDESIEARLHSIRRAASSLSSITACSSCHTPASCQSRSRLQQVIPQPQFISGGRYSHDKPVSSTNKMPFNAARSLTRGRPPLGLGGGFGIKGSTMLQNSSESISFAIMPLYVPSKAGYC